MTQSDSSTGPDHSSPRIAIPGFEIHTELSSGETNSNYLATQVSLDRRVVLKIYSEGASRDEDFRKQVENTARAMARLNHPNLISIYNSGIEQERLYIVMEFVGGKALSRSLAGQPIDHQLALKLTMAVCNGLVHAHENGIAHGDLTAGKILLTQEVQPKIGNFKGVNRKSDMISDIRAAGGLFYEMLTGNSCTHQSEAPSLLVGSPSAWDEIWSRAFHRDNPDSYREIEELAKALEQQTKEAPKSPPKKQLAIAPPKPYLKSRKAIPDPPAYPVKASPRIAAPPTTRSVAPIIPPPTTTASVALKTGKSSGAPRKKLEMVADSAATPPPRQTTTNLTHARKSGSSSHLVRNIVIIAGLLFAIKYVIDAKKAKEDEIAKINAENKEQEVIRIKVKGQNPESPRTEDPGTPPHPPPKPEPPKPKELTLEELQTQLAAGNRSKFPEGTVQRGGCAYLPVEGSFTWPEACEFAERHGAYPAIPSKEADLSWLTALADGKPFWLGAGRNSRTGWLLLNGIVWNPNKEPGGLGGYLAADKFGFLRGAKNHVRLPVILQWQMDGTNPTKLEDRLKATAASIKAGKAEYPSGSNIFGNRVYLVVARGTTWEDARQLAEVAGGHLAVASDAGEAVYLEDLVAHLEKGETYWLGGLLQDGEWSWITGEDWKPTRTAEVSSSESGGLGLSSEGTWHPSSNAEGFIIEWSGDQKT